MQGLTLQATYTIPVWNTLNVHTTTNVKIVNSIAERMTMINEICKLHSKLDFNTEILINMSRYDYQTKIQKADIIKKVDNNTLKVIRPSGEICLINTNYCMLVYYHRRSLL